MKRIVVVVLSLVLLFGVFGIRTTQATETDPMLSIYACNLAFKDNVYIKYAVAGDDLTDVKLLIWTTPQIEYVYGTQQKILNPTGSTSVGDVTCKVFQFTDFAAKQMTDVVYARAYTEKSGVKYYSEVQKYSILQYVYNKVGKTGTATENQKLINLLNAMIEYGALAQIYTGYKTDRLATLDYYQVKVVGGHLDDMCDNGLYLPGEEVNITAPETNEDGKSFMYWQDDNSNVIATEASAIVTVGTVNAKYTAIYGTPSPLLFDSNGDGTCVVIGLDEHTDTEIFVPETSPDGDKVVGIDNSSFLNEDITVIHLPATIEEIGRKAFSGCTNLTDVYFDGTQEQWENIAISSGNDALLNAQIHFKTVDEYFTVTFVDYDGTVISTQQVKKGESATAPENPVREGYTFKCWSCDYSNITEDTVVTAVYTENSDENFTVVFYDYDGTTVLKTETVAEGADATPPSAPSKDGASFVGWDTNYSDVKEDLSVKAVFNDETNIFKLTGDVDNNNNLATVTLALDGNVSLCRFFLTVTYDPQLLKLVDYDNELSLYSPVVNPEKNENGEIVGDADGKINLSWAQSSNKNKKLDIIEMQFEILGGNNDITGVDVIVNGIEMLSGSEHVDVGYTHTCFVFQIQ